MAQLCEAHHGDYSLIEAIFIQYSESYLTIIGGCYFVGK